MVKRNYDGWKPDKLDFRDKLFRNYRLSTGSLPTKVDLRETYPQLRDLIYDQSNLGACTAFGIGSLVEFLQVKDNIQPYEELSKLFLYYEERFLEGTVRKDNGAMIRSGMKVLNKKGCCNSKLWPYKISRFRIKPPKACYLDAETHQSIEYFRILTLTDMLQSLSDGFPFTGGISVFQGFEDAGNDGIIPYPKKNEKPLGGHCVSFFGYDKEKEPFLGKNSWGKDWGENGWFYIPFKYLTNSKLASDLWTLRKMELY
jgi:C1A family cysteine protease